MNSKLYCFIHIERSGGTTLHHLLRQTFFNYYAVPTFRGKYGTDLSSENFVKLITNLPFIKGIGGHTLKSHIGYGECISRNISYFTFLRNPITRYLSQYNYILKYFDKSLLFDEYLKNKKFQNYIVKHISGGENLSNAISHIDTYEFIGLTDSYKNSIEKLGYYLGFQFKGLKNVIPINAINNNSAKFLKLSDLSKSQYNKVKDNNCIDIELYDYVVKNIARFQDYSEETDNLKILHLSQPRSNKINLTNAKRVLIERILFDLILDK